MIRKSLCIILTVLMLAGLLSCAKPPEQSGESASPQGGTPQSGETTAAPNDPDALTQAPGEPDRSYDPMTDCNNMTAGSRSFYLAETEDAFYIHFEGKNYIRYFDKATGDMDVLCPRPECLHDANTPNNKECLGFCSSEAHCLSYYMGKLWWVGPHPSDLYKKVVYCEEPDGSGRQSVRILEMTEELQGGCRFYFHRGRLYTVAIQTVVRDGTPGQVLRFGYFMLDGGEFTEIFSTPSYVNVEATMRFIGDEVYMAAYYDGEEISGVNDDDWDAYVEIASRIHPKTVIMRWNPQMSEPEVLFTTEEKYNYINDTTFYVSREGTPYYIRPHLLDPEKELDQETNPAIQSAYRVEPDGTETELFDSRDGDKIYSMPAISGGAVICVHAGDGMGNGMELWVRSLEGETIYKGPLELGYRNDIVSDEIHMYYPGFTVLGNAQEVFFLFRERFPNNEVTPTRFYLVRYELNGDTLEETLIGEEKTMNGEWG
ncbi:MAG: hypothetical protein J5544_00720 [Clostridia bacterium]|nr:hypothetical protein [Clostridia bacterium]